MVVIVGNNNLEIKYMFSYLKNAWHHYTHPEAKAGVLAPHSLVPAKLNSIIEDLIAKFSTIDARPPPEFYNIVHNYRGQASEMELSVAPIYQEFKDLTIEKVKGKQEFVSSCFNLGSGHMMIFIGKRQDNRFKGKSYTTDGKTID